MASITQHPSHNTHQAKKATRSGWIGSVLEYYDFFIYATAASLIFLHRPIGAFVLGHCGDTRGRKHVLIVCASSGSRSAVKTIFFRMPNTV